MRKLLFLEEFEVLPVLIMLFGLAMMIYGIASAFVAHPSANVTLNATSS